MGGTVDSKSDTVSDGKANKSTAFIAEVRKDEPLVTKRELWSYYRKSYIYYNGDNGSGPYSYTQTLFQNIATAAGYDPVSGPGSSCLADTASGQRVLPWMGSTKSVSSIVLVANGVSFAIMTALFTSISSAGDYGTFGRWLLFVVTAICWASQYACMSLTSPDRWKLAMVLYIIGYVTYRGTLIFYA
ncbi:autophagy-related protein 22-like protein, partial [Melanogaster broomeanus]